MASNQITAEYMYQKALGRQQEELPLFYLKKKAIRTGDSGCNILWYLEPGVNASRYQEFLM